MKCVLEMIKKNKNEKNFNIFYAIYHNIIIDMIIFK
jgi:hypothetical protein